MMADGTVKSRDAVRFGRVIARLRVERELSQEQLARKVRVTKGHISRVESGLTETSVPLLRRLAKALGVKPGDLLDA